MSTILPAKVTAVTGYVFTCPHCGYDIENRDDGSVLWGPEQVRDYYKDGGDVLACNFCDNRSHIPAFVIRWALKDAGGSNV